MALIKMLAFVLLLGILQAPRTADISPASITAISLKSIEHVDLAGFQGGSPGLHGRGERVR